MEIKKEVWEDIVGFKDRKFYCNKCVSEFTGWNIRHALPIGKLGVLEIHCSECGSDDIIEIQVEKMETEMSPSKSKRQQHYSELINRI